MLRPLTDFFFSYTYLRTPGFPSSFFFHPQRNAFLSLPSQSLPRTQSRHPCFTPSPPPRAHFPLPLQYSSASRQHRIPIFLSPSPLRFRCIVTRAMLFPPPLVRSLDTAQRLLWRRPFVPEPRSRFPLSGRLCSRVIPMPPLFVPKPRLDRYCGTLRTIQDACAVRSRRPVEGELLLLLPCQPRLPTVHPSSTTPPLPWDPGTVLACPLSSHRRLRAGGETAVLASAE